MNFLEHDKISLNGLTLWTHIGVTEQERLLAQKILVNIKLFPRKPLSGLEDRLDNTVDYDAVRSRMLEIAKERPRALLETLAEDMFHYLQDNSALQGASIELHKFIYPDCESASVFLSRSFVSQ
ncbi:MAG: dihydroneopterin aldolase [Verrucomicrobiales bacterium]